MNENNDFEKKGGKYEKLLDSLKRYSEYKKSEKMNMPNGRLLGCLGLPIAIASLVFGVFIFRQGISESEGTKLIVGGVIILINVILFSMEYILIQIGKKIDYLQKRMVGDHLMLFRDFSVCVDQVLDTTKKRTKKEYQIDVEYKRRTKE